MKKKLLVILSVVFALVLVACGGNTQSDATDNQSVTQEQSEAIADSGTLYLKVNPEIAIDYDENGLVTDLRADNAEAEEILTDYPDYVGKDSGVVLEELIALIGEAGYFVEEVEGEPKNIVIELEEGAALPGDNFVERMATNAQQAVEDYKTSSEETTDDNTQVSYDNKTIMSLDEAKQIAFDHAGVDGEEARFDDQELKTDDGVTYYELEFDVGPDEYEYDVHAINGEILEFDQAIESGQATTNESSDNANTESISLDEAKHIAFDHAGVHGDEARFDDEELDEDDEVLHYELEFDVGDVEYEYDIHAKTGEILEFEHDD